MQPFFLPVEKNCKKTSRYFKISRNITLPAPKTNYEEGLKNIFGQKRRPNIIDTYLFWALDQAAELRLGKPTPCFWFCHWPAASHKQTQTCGALLIYQVGFCGRLSLSYEFYFMWMSSSKINLIVTICYKFSALIYFPFPQRISFWRFAYCSASGGEQMQLNC